MDLTEHVIDRFHDHIDGAMAAIESLAQGIVEASELLVQALLSEGKILCCGEGSSGLLAQHVAGSLLNRFQRERQQANGLHVAGGKSGVVGVVHVLMAFRLSASEAIAEEAP